MTAGRKRDWAATVALSAVLAGAGERLGLPASLLLGPMIAAAVTGAAGRPVRVARPFFVLAQAIVGFLVARALPPAIFARLAADWPLSAAAILSVVVVATGLGVLLTRLRVLPGTTAIWGSMPGAASAMVLLADGLAADARLVAVSQYLRVVMVATVASVIAAAAGGAGSSVAVAPGGAAGPTLLLIVMVAAASTRLPVPAAPLLAALAIGTTAQDAGLLRIVLPEALLAASYALLGWSFGARFTPDVLRRAGHALPVLVASTAALIGLCALLAVGLSRLAHVSLLTAYLATSPGGADSVAIISSRSRVDVPFVMAMQAGRFLFVLACGPAIARAVAGRMVRGDAGSAHGT